MFLFFEIEFLEFYSMAIKNVFFFLFYISDLLGCKFQDIF